MTSALKISGFKELGQQLEKLESKDMKKAVRTAASKSMRPVARAAKSLAPKESGRLAASIGTQGKANRSKTAFAFRVGVRRNFKYKNTSGDKIVSGVGKQRDRAIKKGFTQDKKSAQMYARVIHFGVDSKGRMRRRAGAKPFLDDAMEANSASVESNFAKELRNYINKVT